MAPAAYHNSVDTAERLEKAGLQHMARACSALPEASVIVILQARRLWAADHVPNVVGVAASRPAIAIMVVLGVLARQRGEATVPRMLAGAAAALLPIMVAPLAAIGLWQLLIMVRPGYATLFMGDPYRPDLYRWALAALTVTILLAWYLTLRRWIGATALAIGALLWPAILGLVTAWLLLAMSYYGSLAVIGAAGGA